MLALGRGAAHIEVTRLTTLKSLRENSKAAAQFAVYLAKQTYQNIRQRKRPSHLDAEKWEAYKALVAKALKQIEAYVKEPTNEKQSALWSVASRNGRALRLTDSFL
jgi:hypothetical protein